MAGAKTFTMDEVARHNKPDDAWVVVNGQVFDVSKFARFHPGGRWVLLNRAGTDASEAFAQVRVHAFAFLRVVFL